MKRRSASHGLLAAICLSGAVVAAVGGAALIPPNAGAQESALIENMQEVTATVREVDPETRLISLEMDNGDEFVVEAGDDVRNFDQIEAGDLVDVTFYEALAAELTREPASDADEPLIIGSNRAPLGARPKGAVGLVYTAVVTIDDVDLEHSEVSFTGPGGRQRHVAVERPELQEFIKGLSEGDRVRLTFAEALAVAVRPAETRVALPD